MEDEEKLANKRFKVYFNLSGTLPYYEVINTYDYDRKNNFVGIFGVVTKESILKVANEIYGIEENEIEFIEIDVRNSY